MFLGCIIFGRSLNQVYLSRDARGPRVGRVRFRDQRIFVGVGQGLQFNASERFVRRPNVCGPLGNRLGVVNSNAFSRDSMGRFLIFFGWLKEGTIPCRSSAQGLFFKHVF